ncbi:MAG: DUF58 domain-containing protein [Spirochaetaceae bacterium]|nr:DUF58 domain-containing protein [Spirochaetaceae bacterium]
MPESTESKRADRSGILPDSSGSRRPGGGYFGGGRGGRFFIRPRFSACFLIPLSTGLLVLGLARGELALTLPGAAFASALVYSFAGVLFLAVFHRKRGSDFAAVFVPRQLERGGQTALLFSGLKKTKTGRPRRLFSLPGIVMRYELHLETRDGRKIRHIFDPGKEIPPLDAVYRGAYYGAYDIFSVSDIPGFFIAGLPCAQEKDARLLVSPSPGEDPVPIRSRSGGERERVEPFRVRTDELSSSRPYVSGDDPRRINWKLYGHGGELFVREGEREPPPRSRMAVLIDTLAEQELFSGEAGRRVVDRCCEYALALVLDQKDRGIEVLLGYSGQPGGLCSGEFEDLAGFLAYPAAGTASEKLPQPPGDEGVVIFLLPRNYSGPLDAFLSRRKAVELVFLYENEKQEEAAGLCVRRYGQRGGCRAHCFRV